MINLEQVRWHAREIRVHGNGFIQVESPALGENARLHVWGHPDIPRQSEPSPIHDHAFGFVSEVLVGRVVNVRYFCLSPVEDAGQRYALYEAHCRHRADTELVRASGGEFVPIVAQSEVVSAGQRYEMLPYDFHETVPLLPSATLMRKTRTTDHAPRVLVRAGREPDNAFNRYGHDAEKLWGIVREVLEQ